MYIIIKDYRISKKSNLGSIYAKHPLFKPSTVPSRPEQERVLTDITKIGFLKNENFYL